MFKWTVFVSLFALSILLVIIVPFSTPCFAKEKDQLVISQRMDVNTLDWTMTSSMETGQVSRSIFDRLVIFDKNYQYAPMLAISWKVLDNTTWHFALRKGVKFHNGEIFDANSVKFSIDRMKSPETKSPWAWIVKNIEKVNIIDDYNIELKTTIPQPSLLFQLTYVNIVPPKTVRTVGNSDFGSKPCGTGPYKFVEWVKDERVVLEANESYWKGAPKIKKVVFRPIPEESSRVSALMTGEIDIATDVPPSRWEDLRKNKETKISSKIGTMIYLGLNTFIPPFNNVKVRKALNHGVDVQSIIDSVISGTAERMNGPFFKNTIGYDSVIEPYNYDINKAKKLLEEAGYPNGFESVLTCDPVGKEGATNMPEVAEAIAFQLQKLGIKIKVELQERSVMWPKYEKSELKMFFFTWPERWDPEVYLRPLFHSKARGYYYKNPVVDNLIDQGGSTFGSKERTEIYRNLHRVLFEDAPWVYLYKQNVGFGSRRSVKFDPPHDGYVYPFDYSFN